ncbi:hypothetical protein D3Z52_07130 [Clostridiaceae bacterium]|nr:hypothetical protein [Clostridiaceae bacterium]
MPEVQLKEGTVFEAVDNLRNKFLYRFERVDRADGPDRAYKLWNLTTNEATEVEKAWFGQRKIRKVGQ